MFDFTQYDLTKIDLSNESNEGSNVLNDGWYKLTLDKVGEERQTASGTALGSVFTFKVVDGVSSGATFDRWYCTQATDTKMAWSQKVFVSTMLRLAQCVGLARLSNIQELLNRPFYAYIVTKERTYDSKEIDAETGLPVKKTATNNEFKAGKLTDVYLSCNEYDAKFNSQANANFQFNFNPNVK